MTNRSSFRFIYGRPVKGEEFIGRFDELRAVCNRIRNGESTAIVGEPHIGKTSFLLRLADPLIYRQRFGSSDPRIIPSFIDLQSISSRYDPPSFWGEALRPLIEHPKTAANRRKLEALVDENFPSIALERFFRSLAKANYTLVLLLDEFERLLVHPNFQDPSFFGLLRKLCTHIGGLLLVTASRMSVAEMNRYGRKLLDMGSPFFNNMIEVRLPVFDRTTSHALLSQANNRLSDTDIRFILRTAGRHPFLLQAMTASLLEREGPDRYESAAEYFYERTAFHFEDLWIGLDDASRTTAVILCLLEFGGRVLGSDFNYGEIENVPAFGPELRRLADRGLAEKVSDGWEFDFDNLLIWHGERWAVGCQAFSWWVRDVILPNNRTIPSVDEWLTNQRYRGLLTQKQWDELVGAFKKVPEWALRGVGTLAGQLFKELSRPR